MDLGIRGKWALVTAASGGMGRNLADALAAEGANLVLFSRSGEALEELANRMRSRHGINAEAVAGSMLIPEDVNRLASRLEELGGPDITVLVTGRAPTPLRRAVEETELDRWSQAYKDQLAALVSVVNAVSPLMVARGSGRIVAITSAHAKQPAPGHTLSSVFRAGVTAYLKELATDLAPHAITVNCVAPALIDSSHRTGSAAYTEGQAARRRTMTPLGRMGTQEELGSAVAYLASTQAGFITGATLTVDGGMTNGLF